MIQAALTSVTMLSSRVSTRLLCRYVEAQGLRPRRRLADIIQHSPSHKGRLLHYLPSQPGHNSQQRWCGQHTDFCSLTGVCQMLHV